jgi:hypothetical protein
MKSLVIRAGFLAVLVLTMAAHQLAGQPAPLLQIQPDATAVTKSGADCSGGVISDDGTFEFGASFPNSYSSGVYAMRVQLPAGQNQLTAVCIAWSSQGTAPTIHFDVNVWAADGAGGAPGTFLGRIANATVTAGNTGPTFYRLTFPAPLTVSTSTVYVGPAWDPSSYPNWFIGLDTDGPGGQSAYDDAFVSSGTPPNQQLGTAGNIPNYRALGIRVEAQAGTVGTCTPGPETMCLNNNRFQVQATFDAGGGNAGMAHTVKQTDDTGFLWFFSATNIEAVIKVLDACTFNSRFWVFAGGLTNVKVTTTVTDTQTGAFKVYRNPANTPFQPLQDTSAFACP